jgi:DNA repair protein RadC
MWDSLRFRPRHNLGNRRGDNLRDNSIIDNRFCRGTPITSPAASQDFLRLRLGHLEHEIFSVLWLDNRHRVLSFEELFRGTIDGASVHLREVVKSGLKHNAVACILAHNHPSGVSEPSAADRSITQKLKDALTLIGVRVLDHIIIGEDNLSFAEQGLL